MLTKCGVASMFSGIAMLLLLSSSFGQSYPNKPIRVLAGSIGGGGDFTSRQVAQGVSGFLGQQLIVENRPGSYSDIVSKAPPDGYTLLVAGSPHWIVPL